MPIACDTSVLVPALLPWHADHEQSRRVLEPVTALPAHVLLETYSVLTRLPSPHRIASAQAADVLDALDWALLAPPGREISRLVSLLGTHDLRGGATYDALVAATARHHGHRLLTRDRRARRTYEMVGAEFELV